MRIEIVITVILKEALCQRVVVITTNLVRTNATYYIFSKYTRQKHKN